MAKKSSRKKTVNPADRQGTRRFFTIAAICTLVLLILLYGIYTLS
ncbi:MAG: hypothetical protein AAF828_08905 [Bacteroidota bacterium]